MIYDKLKNIARYKGMSENLDKAIDFLCSHDLKALPAGRNDVDGEVVYINHFGYTTVPKTDGSLFEDHMEYLDLHVDLEGEELILVAPASVLTECEKRLSEDAVMYTGEAAVALPLTAEDFCLVFPGEAHLPKIHRNGESKVNKCVFKIRF